MEDSHFNSSSYFWPAVPTVSGQCLLLGEAGTAGATSSPQPPLLHHSLQRLLLGEAGTAGAPNSPQQAFQQNSLHRFLLGDAGMEGNIENSMFLNKVKDQLMQEKGCNLGGPHYLSVPTSGSLPASISLPSGITMDTQDKEHMAPHSQASVTQNITVVPVQSAGLMTAAGLVITSPSGSMITTSSGGHTFPISAPPAMIISALQGSQALQVVPDLSKLKDGSGLPKPGRGRKKKLLPDPTLPDLHDPYDLSNEDNDEHHKDGKTYRCRMCSVTFFSKSEMQIHSKSHTETKPHKCPHCSKTFANSSYLAQHVRIHSGAKPYTCNYCQKSFRQLSHLQQHTRIHTKVLPQTKPHKCPHCSKTFANGSYLAQHVRIHSGAKPYSCNYCQKSFRQLSHLQQHTRIHTGDRPYKCVHPGCDKAFTQLSNLQSHRRQHNKDKPFKCHNCHRAYTDATSLEVHLSSHTVKHAKVYTCSICSRAYTSETYLMKHMRKHNAPEQQQTPSQMTQQVMTSQGVHYVSGPQSSDAPQCSFDLNLGSYKSDQHKDICLTVTTSTIQVEHLASS